MLIADYMRTQAVKRMLRLVYGNPDRIFTLKELLDCAGGGRGLGARHVERLVSAKALLEEERCGNQRNIRLNPDSPLYAELHCLSQDDDSSHQRNEPPLGRLDNHYRGSTVRSSVSPWR